MCGQQQLTAMRYGGGVLTDTTDAKIKGWSGPGNTGGKLKKGIHSGAL
jgi:hypothetical protein